MRLACRVRPARSVSEVVPDQVGSDVRREIRHRAYLDVLTREVTRRKAIAEGAESAYLRALYALQVARDDLVRVTHAADLCARLCAAEDVNALGSGRAEHDEEQNRIDWREGRLRNSCIPQ